MKKTSIYVLFFIVVCGFFMATGTAHIVGPEIVEPSASGWILEETNPGVTSSKVVDLERVALPGILPGEGLFFCGCKEYENGSTFGWFGATDLHGEFIFQREISNPYFTNARSCQVNTTEVIYVAGYGPSGCSMYMVNFSGNIFWNMTFGEPGDILNQIAIIKIDGAAINNNNGISAVGVKAGGKRGFYCNIDEHTQSVNFNYSVGDDSGNEWDEVLAVATDPYLEDVAYLGGRKAISSTTPERYDGFIIQLNLTTMASEWEQVLSNQQDTAIQAIQVEPVEGGVVGVGYMGDDALVYPLAWWGDEIWELVGDKPYLLWGGTEQDEATDVIILGESTYMIYFTGTTASYGWNKDAFVVKMNIYKELEWEKSYGDMGEDTSATLTGEPAMSVFIGGASDDKFFIVQNPAGDINAFTKFFGSVLASLLFVLIASTAGIAILITAYLIVKKRKKENSVSNWIQDLGQKRKDEGKFE